MNRDETKRAVANISTQLLRSKGFISPVDVLLTMGKLTQERYERWRFKQIPFLEKVVEGNLNALQFLLRAIRQNALDRLHLKPSRTVYTSWGKGRRQRLRFSKTGHPRIEELYSTHYVLSKPPAGRPGPSAGENQTPAEPGRPQTQNPPLNEISPGNPS